MKSGNPENQAEKKTVWNPVSRLYGEAFVDAGDSGGNQENEGNSMRTAVDELESAMDALPVETKREIYEQSKRQRMHRITSPESELKRLNMMAELPDGLVRINANRIDKLIGVNKHGESVYRPYAYSGLFGNVREA